MRALTAYIVLSIMCMYYLNVKQSKYKSTDEIIGEVVTAALGGAIGGAVAEIAVSGQVSHLPSLYGGY